MSYWRLSVLPGFILLAGAIVALLARFVFSKTPMVGALADQVASYAFPVALVLAFVVYMWNLLAVLEWQRNPDAAACRHCGGPLGHIKDGRWGPYSKCFACGRNTPRT